MPDENRLTDDFKQYAATKLIDSLDQIRKCLSLLAVEQIWHRPNEVSNAIGNLVLHLNGNIRMWIVSSLGDEPYERDRASEFGQRDPVATGQILGALEATVARAADVIRNLTPTQLATRHSIQGHDVSGQVAVFHAIEHFSLHTGQIVYATKILTGQDLSLYDSDGQRLDEREESVP
jgi:uncharacterized damage-inducible protein DinB